MTQGGKIAIWTAVAVTGFMVSFWYGWNGVFSEVRAVDEEYVRVLTQEEEEWWAKEDVAPQYEHGFESGEFFDDAYKGSSLIEKSPAQSALVAHHLLVADKIAEVFKKVRSNEQRTVFVLSPNHFSAGRSSAQVSKGTWETPYGDVRSDEFVVQKLMVEMERHAEGSLSPTQRLTQEEEAFGGEHGVGALTPFVARSLPNSRIVPILLHDSFPPEARKLLAEAIIDVAPNALVIASVDMSHYLPQYAAEFHDELTLQYLENGGCDCEVDLEVDANAVLEVLMEVNRLRGTQDFHMTHHDSSLGMSEARGGSTEKFEENTSHILGVFEEGEPKRSRSASMVVVGDVMLDRYIRTVMDEHGVEYPWEKIGRFLSGTHLAVGNLEGTVGERESKMTFEPPFAFSFTPDAVKETAKHLDVVSLANNHTRDFGADGERETWRHLEKIGLPSFGSWTSPRAIFRTTLNGEKVAFVGYHAFHSNKTDLINVIRLAKKEGRFTVVMPHWGNEYELTHSNTQRALAEDMVSAGADVILGSHPHVVQDIEVIDGVPVVYSMGNFIFDQVEEERQWELAVGIRVFADSFSLHLLPVHSDNGQPSPVSDSFAKMFLKNIAERSPESLRSSIENGILEGKLR